MDAFLKKFETNDRRTVLSWIENSNDLYNWSAKTEYPLVQSIFEKWHSDPEIHAYLLVNDNEQIAYGEIWFDASDGSAELARIIVNPMKRRQGHAVNLVRQLVNKINKSDFSKVLMRVVPGNSAALQCYLKAGFTRMQMRDAEVMNKGEKLNYVWLKL